MSDTGSIYSVSSSSSPTARPTEGAHVPGVTRDDRRKAKEALLLQQSITEAVRLAIKERESSKEAQNERLEQKRIKEKVFDLDAKVGNCMKSIQEIKQDKSVEILQQKLDKANAHIKELKKENKSMVDKFNHQIERLEEKINTVMNSERTKRLSLFNRWAKKHSEDVENLRMSVEESLTHIDERSNREWEKQGRALDVLREKIDITLIRRLGYLPTTNANVGLPDSHYVSGLNDDGIAVVEAPAHAMAASTVEGEGKMHDIIKGVKSDGREEEKEDAALRSKISAFFAYGSPPKKRLDMNLGVDTDDTTKYLNRSGPCKTVQLPTSSISMEHNDLTINGALFNQGLDAHQVIGSMESRMEEVARHIQQLSKARQLAVASDEMVAERNRRLRQLRNPSANLSSDDEYPGSDEREFKYGLPLETYLRKEGDFSSDEEGQGKAKKALKETKLKSASRKSKIQAHRR